MFRAGIPICDHSRRVTIIALIPNYISKSIPERLSVKRGETQSDDNGLLSVLKRVCQPRRPLVYSPVIFLHESL